MLCSRQNGTEHIYTKDCKKYEKLGKFYFPPPGKKFPLLDSSGGTLIPLAEHQGSTEA